jgi:D-alanine transaminase
VAESFVWPKKTLFDDTHDNFWEHMMDRIVYVNGEYLPETQATVSIFDRGLLFADAVYEVSAILDGRLLDNEAHLARLARSLDELEMESPVSPTEIIEIQKTLIERNQVKEGMVYLQISRGVADREFALPAGTAPTLFMFTQARPVRDNPKAKSGMSVVTVPDIRWARRDIKTVGLLGPVLAVRAAKQAGADDAWMVEDGFVTECSASNAYIVSDENTIITRHLGSEILHGITRVAMLRLSKELDITLEERPFSVAEALRASEAFITGASSIVIPVVSIDGQPIGDGTPGPVSNKLRELYLEQSLQ